MADRREDIKIKTGTYEVSPTERDHIYVDGHSTVRGKTQQTSAHFHLWSDGKWHLGAEGKSDHDQRSNFYAHGGATKPFADAAILDLTAAVNNWAEDHVAELAAAEEKHQAHGLATRRDELQKHLYAATVLKAEIDRIEAGEHLPTYCEGVRPWYEGPTVPKDFVCKVLYNK